MIGPPRKILFVVNDLAASTLPGLLENSRIHPFATLRTDVPGDASQYDLVVLWNYRRIISGLAGLDNIVVFHASALPQDRGWAPLYHTIAQSRENVTLSVIRPIDEVDAGPLVARASFPNNSSYTASLVRRRLEQIALEIADNLSADGRIRRMKGRPQEGRGNVNGRRSPAQSEVKAAATLAEILPHVRACEPGHPAFVSVDGRHLILEVRPLEEPYFPAPHIDYYD